MGSEERARILLADDHVFFLEGAKFMLETRYEVVGTVTDGDALLAAALELKPDVVLLDIDMPVLDGLEAARQLKQHCGKVKIVFLTGKENSVFVHRALQVGASGYLMKTAGFESVTRAVEEALAGRFLMTEDVRGQLAAPAADPEDQGEQGTDDGDLTDRQREVLRLLAQGKTMKEAAAALRLKPRTIADHKYRIMEKLRVRTNAELMQYAFRKRLV